MKHRALLLASAALLALAGCHKTVPRAQTAGNASGEILPGAASDAMLPLDSLHSAPPVAAVKEGGAGGDASDTSAKKHHAAAADASDPAADPAATPADPSAVSAPEPPAAALPPPAQ